MYYRSKRKKSNTKIKIFYSLIFVVQPVLFNGCFIDEQINCRMHFALTVVNTTDDTLKVVPGKNGRYSSKVQSFSFKEAIVAPSLAVTLEVDYGWTGTNECAVGCIDEDYNGDLFEMSFFKGDSLIENRRIVPCTPCDEPSDDMIFICEDCVEEFADTIYFSR